MLCITLLSGAEIAHVPLAELAHVKALKQHLHEHHSLPPRFRQRLLHEGNALDDSVTLDSLLPEQRPPPCRQRLSKSSTPMPTSDSSAPEQCQGCPADSQEPPKTAEEVPAAADPLPAATSPTTPSPSLGTACVSVLGHDALDESAQTPPDNAMAAQGRGRKRVAEGSTHFDREASVQVLLLPFCEASDRERTEICNAAYDGVLSKVEYFLQLPMDPDTTKLGGDTALMCACENCRIDVAELLLEAAAQVDFRNSLEKTALMIAAQEYGCAPVVQLLLASRAQVDLRGGSFGRTALMCAAFNGHSQAVKLLLDARAETNLRDTLGKTALSYANLFRDHATARLLEAGS
ncbi:mask [Symbiodinium sp. CCMP2592]|nr:mask [Symbiodinium sp. CCMP2592]